VFLAVLIALGVPQYFRYDDPGWLHLAKDQLHRPWAILSPGLDLSPYSGLDDYYRPAVGLLWWAIYRFAGTNPLPYQIASGVLFAVSVFYLFFVARTLLGRLGAWASVAGFLAYAPIVAYGIYRMGLLHLGQAALLASAYHLLRGARGSRTHFLFGVVCALVAALSRQTAALILPAVAVTYALTECAASRGARVKRAALVALVSGPAALAILLLSPYTRGLLGGAQARDHEPALVPMLVEHARYYASVFVAAPSGLVLVALALAYAATWLSGSARAGSLPWSRRPAPPRCANAYGAAPRPAHDLVHEARAPHGSASTPARAGGSSRSFAPAGIFLPLVAALTAAPLVARVPLVADAVVLLAALHAARTHRAVVLALAWITAGLAPVLAFKFTYARYLEEALYGVCVLAGVWMVACARAFFADASPCRTSSHGEPRDMRRWETGAALALSALVALLVPFALAHAPGARAFGDALARTRMQARNVRAVVEAAAREIPRGAAVYEPGGVSGALANRTVREEASAAERATGLPAMEPRDLGEMLFVLGRADLTVRALDIEGPASRDMGRGDAWIICLNGEQAAKASTLTGAQSIRVFGDSGEKTSIYRVIFPLDLRDAALTPSQTRDTHHP
jgi:hypothetical protein